MSVRGGALRCSWVFSGVVVFLGLFSSVTSWAGDQVCSGSVIVWDHKVRKAEREALKIEARNRAFQDLAAQASVRAAVLENDERVVRWNDSGFHERFLSLTNSRSAITITELLHGGEYQFVGDKKNMKVRYCLPHDRFLEARSQVLEEWERIENQIRRRFGDLEKAIERGDLSYARELFPALKSDVTDLVMDREEYTSELTGKTNTFKGWLELWTREVRSERAYADYCVGEAQALIADARLSKAQRFVEEALEADHHNVRAIHLGTVIEKSWDDRNEALREAVSAAAVGKEHQAERLLEKAQSIDKEEVEQFGEARTKVEGLLASFKEDNPRFAIGLDLGYGNMGADSERTFDRYFERGPYDIKISKPLMLGLTGRVRINRFLQAWASYRRGTAGVTLGGRKTTTRTMAYSRVCTGRSFCDISPAGELMLS